MSIDKKVRRLSSSTGSRDRYNRRVRGLYSAVYCLGVLLLAGVIIITPFARALPGDYTWQRAGVVGINGDRSSNWSAIASSADGTKLAVADMYSGFIYTSNDSGATWTERSATGAAGWQSIASSADGTKLVAAEAGGFIYTSSDSGATWTERSASGEHYWLSVISSADGTKLVAAESDGFIYTSDDSGATWTERTAVGSHLWQSIASSADGTKLVAAGRTYYDNTALSFVGSIYTSDDSGATWTEQTAAGVRAWISAVSSADGTRLAAIETHYDDAAQTFVGSIYTSDDSGATWTERTAVGSHQWQSIASSADGTKLTATADPGTLHVSTDSGITWTEQITVVPLHSVISSASGVKLAAFSGSSIYTSFDSGATWTQRTVIGSRSWCTIASSVDGIKLVAAACSYGENAYIYTSTDSGATWTEQAAAGSRHWNQIVSSADGVKLAAIGNNSIYTSADSGATWTEQTAAGLDNWQSIATSADGTKLAAVPFVGSIYTSVNSGVSWTERTSAGSQYWTSIASSADGTRLTAVETHYDDVMGTNVGSIYTSTDSGITWTERTVVGEHEWRAITSSADGVKLAVTEAHYDETTASNIGSVYISSDSGATWTQRITIAENQYEPITSSADGTKLAVAISGDGVYTSVDSGANWTKQIAAGVRNWRTLTMSASGTTLAAAVMGGSIHLATMNEETTGGSHTVSFDYGTLGSSESRIAADAVLTVTSSSCYMIDTSRAFVLGTSGISIPTTNVSIVGGIDYAVNCTSQGGSMDVTVTLGSYYSDLTRLRIYKKSASSPVLADVTSQVTLENTTGSNDTPITTLRYTLIDGGDYDEDGVANATIVDPLYFGILAGSSAGTLANTGNPQWGAAAVALSIITLAAAFFVIESRVHQTASRDLKRVLGSRR